MRTNSCFLVGNLGADPVERSRNPKTGPVVGFSVAENVQSFDAESQTYQTVHTNWFSITAFGTLGERALQSLKKGDRVVIQGKMKVRTYQDKTGAERSGFEIIADELAHYRPLAAVAGESAAGATTRIQGSSYDHGIDYEDAPAPTAPTPPARTPARAGVVIKSSPSTPRATVRGTRDARPDYVGEPIPF